MKLRVKSSWIGIFLIGVMLFSTFAYAVIQSFSTKGTQVKLPKSNIIDYQLEANLANALIQNGATIITFEYNLKCDNCLNQKYSLESLANEYKNQIFLEELNNDGLNKSTITITSFYGQDKFVDINDTGVVNSLCKLMINPPVTCAFQKT